MSNGDKLLSVLLRNLRCCFVRISDGNVPAEEAPEAYPDSRFEEADSRCIPILIERS